jgi:hypothetical protein
MKSKRLEFGMTRDSGNSRKIKQKEGCFQNRIFL